MNVDCPHCQLRVQARVIAEHVDYDSFDEYEGPESFRTLLLECSSCFRSLLLGQYSFDYPDEDGIRHWSRTSRLWPPLRQLSSEIPESVRSSLEEAEKCYKGRAYNATAVMVGRGLEGICQHFKTKDVRPAAGLKELRDREIIDRNIYEWGEELRKHRNIGAHEVEQNISKEDAEDVLNFIIAICEYIFVLKVKFESFMKRQKRQTQGSGAG